MHFLATGEFAIDCKEMNSIFFLEVVVETMLFSNVTQYIYYAKWYPAPTFE